MIAWVNGKISRRFLLIVLLFALPVEVLAKDDPISIFSSTPLRVDVDLVNLAFSVLDKNQCQVQDIKKEDLVLYEDEVKQEISVFAQESAPLSLIVLLDVSGSLAPFTKQVSALTGLLPTILEPGDEAAVIAFSDIPNVLQEFTQEKTKIRCALDLPLSTTKGLFQAKDSVFFNGPTNISDSVYLASRKLEMSGPEKRRVIVLISDGMGNRGDNGRAYDELRTCGATLMSIGLGLTSKFHGYSTLLNRWIKNTGGALVMYSPEPEMERNLQLVFQKVRTRYGIAYSPSNKKKDGKYRRIRMAISLNSPLYFEECNDPRTTRIFRTAEYGRTLKMNCAEPISS
jgi:Ca-activated chloride channel family protein